MKVAIMQPYFCPYIGYFQLINAVDKFVIYDDAQFMKGGWINRNRILLNKEKLYKFTLSIANDSYTLNINERYYIDNIKREKNKILKTIRQSYSKALYYNDVKELIQKIFSIDELNVAKMNTKSLKMICDYLNIKTEFLISSKIEKNNRLGGQELVIDINKCLNADHYINTIGGTDLYSKDIFKEHNIKLNFINTKKIEYIQFDNEYIPNLSIIDVMMFNSKEKIKDLLNEYELI